MQLDRRTKRLRGVSRLGVYPPFGSEIPAVIEAGPVVHGHIGGKMEKRLPIAIVVNLAHVEGPGACGTEVTYTDDLSAHGACVVSGFPWRPGEAAEISSLQDQIALRGKVVYCRRKGDGRYAIGLTFQGRSVAWPTYLRYTGAVGNNALLEPACAIYRGSE